MTTLTPTLPPAGSPNALGPIERPPGFATAVGQTSLRTILAFIRTPQLIGVSLVQGSMFLLIFRYVFGGAIGTGSISYVDFLVPGFVLTTILFAGTGASAGVAEDLSSGLVERMRSLPVPRASVLVGRAVADTVLLIGTLALTTAIGFLVGLRFHAGPGSALLAFGLCVLAGFAFEWMFILLGLLAGNAQAAQGMAMIAFPFTFVSSAYVPVHSMPGWMQAVAERQPITVMVDATRALCVGAQPGQSTGGLVLQSVVWCAALVAVFAPLAMLRFNRR